MGEQTGTAAVDRFVAGIEAGRMTPDLLCPDIVLDATVPNWRFSVRGGPEVSAELSGWYAAPGRFESLRRRLLPDGELVEFTLSWEEHGVAHSCHQAHILLVRDGRIGADTVFCGGRWPAPLLAEMREAGLSQATS